MYACPVEPAAPVGAAEAGSRAEPAFKPLGLRKRCTFVYKLYVYTPTPPTPVSPPAPPPPLEGAQPMPSHCPPGGRRRLQRHL